MAAKVQSIASLCALLFLLSTPSTHAQQIGDDKPYPITTLHVYTNLIQIPVLVLNRMQVPIKAVAADRFTVSLDSGPWFRPTHVRVEGDEPLALAIVLDTTGPDKELLQKMDAALASLFPISLHPQDRISIYAVGCSVTSSLRNSPPNSADLVQATRTILEAANQARDSSKPECRKTPHIWDALFDITQQLSQVPGRRAILAMTDGNDRGSSRTWNELRGEALWSSVAIFGINGWVPARGLVTPTSINRFEGPFPQVCQLTGGTILSSSPGTLPHDLGRFVEMLRQRYIVEFPRPVNATLGEHRINVNIANSDAFIRAAGEAFSLASDKEKSDRLSLPGDPGQGPVQGSRKVLSNPNPH